MSAIAETNAAPVTERVPAEHPLAQAPVNFVASTLARHSETAGALLDRYQRWRRETWWHNEMGDRQSHFKPVEQFRR